MTRETIGSILFFGPLVVGVALIVLMMPVGVVVSVYAIYQGDTDGWKALSICLPATSMMLGVWVYRV